ncbi:hypothetical protein QL285_088088 [Trifolium repens]|nr:hypothetical protein QL285_088088 [Trifolium repens]
MSTASKTTPSTKTNTPPPSPKPNSPHHEEIQSDMIVNATPVSMIKHSGSKKRKSKRSRRESTPIAVEEVVVPSPSTEKSKKKKKKSKKSKTGTPKRVHTMESLHTDPLPAETVDAAVDASVGIGSSNPNPEKASLKISSDQRHPMTQKIIDSVFKALQEPDVMADVGTSLPQGEEESPVDKEETIATEEQPVTPDSPEQEIVEEDQPAEVEEPENDTQSDKGKEAKSSVDVEDSNPSDKDVDGDTTIVDVEDYDSDLPLNMIAKDSIARTTRSGKGPATVGRSPAATKEKKKPVKRQVLYGPKKGYSKAVVPPAKKKTQKRKEPPTSDSEYDVEQDVAHIRESEDESAEEHNVEFDAVHIESAVKKSYGKKKIPQGIPDIPVDLISFHNPAHAGKWKYIAHRRLALERELSAEALQCKEVMKLIKHAGLMKTVSGLSDCYEKVVKEFLVNIPAGCDNPLDKEYQTVFVRGKEIHFSPTVINKFLGRSEEPYAEMEANDNYIIKVITAGKVKSWPKKEKLQASKLTPIYNILNRIAAANWVPTTHNCDVATGLARFIYTVGNKINYDFGTYIFYQTIKHAKTLAVKLPIAFPSLLCGIILSQRPDVLGKDDLSCRRETAISFSLKQSDVTPDVGTSSSTNAMSRTDMIAALKGTCKALEEKKAKLEAVIAGLELEDEQTMAEDEELEEEEPNDSEAEETDGSQDI